MPKHSQEEVPIDGRRQRSERSRHAIIQSALMLMNDGILAPTAQQISDNAGVGIRSFFRHFEDMEALFAAADESFRSDYEALFIGGDRDGTLSQRILHAIERRADAYIKVSNVWLGTRAQLWRYETLRKNYARNQRGLRKDLNDWLPELKLLPREQREAVDAIASHDMWHRLYHTQGLSKKLSVKIISGLVGDIMQSR